MHSESLQAALPQDTRPKLFFQQEEKKWKRTNLLAISFNYKMVFSKSNKEKKQQHWSLWLSEVTHHLVTYIVSYNKGFRTEPKKKERDSPWNHHPVVLHNHWGKTEPLKYNVWIHGGFPAHLLFYSLWRSFFFNIQQHLNPLILNKQCGVNSVSLPPQEMIANFLLKS